MVASPSLIPKRRRRKRVSRQAVLSFGCGIGMKKPGGGSHRVRFNGFQRLASACGPGRGNAFPSLRFALLAPPKFARLFVALLQLQALEKAVILDLFFQNAHCFFDVIVDDPDFDFLQLYRPFRAAGNDAMVSSPADS